MCEYEGCHVPSEPGEKLCILHLASPKDAKRFKETLYLQIDEEGSEGSRNSQFNFVGYNFPGGITNYYSGDRMASPDAILPRVMVDVSFRGATIGGIADLHGATMTRSVDFSDSQVAGIVNFSDATIVRDALFENAKIGGDAFFTNAKIGHDVDFRGATIEGKAYFWSVEIERNVIFNDTSISDCVDFGEAKIGGVVNFDDARIGGYADFGYAQITRSASFDCAEIEGIISFHKTDVGAFIFLNNARVKGNANFQDTTIKGEAYFSGATIEGEARFNGMTMNGSVHFKRCSAGSVDLGLEKPRMRGWRLSFDRCGVLLCDVQTASFFWKFAQRNFSRNGERVLADVAFCFERIWHWKALRKIEAGGSYRYRGVRTALLRTGFWVLWGLDCLLLRWTTAYGASIARLFTTWFVVIGGFGIVFSLRPSLIQGPSVNGLLWDWIRGFHYSISTFATLGLGNIDPGSSRLGMALTSIEAILGTILIALAVLVIGRKFMR